MPPQDEMYERFREFHLANPQVFSLFVKFANHAANSRRRFGARLIGERIRWHTAIETSGDEFKVNNDYWPYYAKLLPLVDQRFVGFFSSRNGASDVDDNTLFWECGFKGGPG